MVVPAPKSNILLVDDRHDKLLALETMLEPLDQNLVSVRSGNEALRELLRSDFAVIVLDVNMPGMDGFETAALIRQRKDSETTPIIFISAVNATETHVSRGYSLGAVDYILTPVVPEILRAKIAVFVDLSQKTAQIKRQAQEHAELVREQAARAEAESARQRLAFLAEASNVLAGSLDYRQTFDNLAQLVVPRLADFCIIDRLDENGQLRTVAVAHRDSEKEGRLRELRDAEPAGQLTGALGVFESAKPVIYAELTDEATRDLFPGSEGDVVRDLGAIGCIAVPLVARGQPIGTIRMAVAEPGRPCGANELSLAEELAHRAALALDNAGLFHAADSARKEAEAASRAKDRFLAMLSHELRTPLTPVIASLINLKADKSIPDTMREPLEVIRRNVELEARLIDDLLDLTRVGTGKIRLNPEVVEVGAILKNAIEICQPDISAKELELTVEADIDGAHVFGDPARLQQIFWNLLKNGVKFTSSGSITVTAAVEGDPEQLRVEVADTGVGINPDLLPRIFNPFEQGQSGAYGGLGLGLSITRALVELHEGTIDAASAGPGEGSTFTVRFPLVEAPDPEPPRPESGTDGDNASIHILLVEDHVDSNNSLTIMLRLLGYEVTSAYDVKSALRLARDHAYDALISDLGLPDGNAGEVMAAVSENSSAVGIAISGYGMEKDFRRSRDYGFSHHLVKPVAIDRLQSVLKEIATAEKSSPQPARPND